MSNSATGSRADAHSGRDAQQELLPGDTTGTTPQSSGVSIAPVGDPGPAKTLAASSRVVSRVSFLPRNGKIVIAMVTIVATHWFALFIGASGTALGVVSITSCFLVGVALSINNSLRWEHAENAYEKEKSASEDWQSRFRRLYSDLTRTSAVLSHMTDGIVLLSPSTEILLINDAAKGLLAIPSDGVHLGRRVAEMVRIPEIVHAVERTRAENVDHNVSVEIVDGSTVRPVSVRVSRIHDAEPPHLLLVVHDETEAHRVEAIRREFIANVSHELKTPLAAIKGYAETVELAIEDDPESAKHFIGQIDTQCQRLETLIADMMRLARAQSGKGTLVVRTIDLQDVVQQALASFSPVAAAKEIELIVTGRTESVHVLADEEAALTITQNLISNALRHTEAGGLVTVSYRQEDAGWIMAVKDDGVGIAEEFQERIFERFYRVDRTRKSHDGGTGIGLSIVKNLTRALGGNVRVISRPGEGATFEVWLPAPN